tara:strand:+ start:315 stop:470 length:156 start_codon:yes stop_codon:yes gene_type:complete
MRQLAGEKVLRDCRNPAALDLYWQIGKSSNLSEARNPYLVELMAELRLLGI